MWLAAVAFSQLILKCDLYSEFFIFMMHDKTSLLIWDMKTKYKFLHQQLSLKRKRLFYALVISS